jgi:hypothetical protein
MLLCFPIAVIHIAKMRHLCSHLSIFVRQAKPSRFSRMRHLLQVSWLVWWYPNPSLGWIHFHMPLIGYIPG